MPWSSYSEQSGTYAFTITSSEADINWGFDSAYSENRTFLLEYDVVGALRVYLNAVPPNQQIWWTAVATEVTDLAPVEHASMTIVLPKAVKLADALVAGPGSTEPGAHSTDGKIWTWTVVNLTSGDSLEVRLQFPPLANA